MIDPVLRLRVCVGALTGGLLLGAPAWAESAVATDPTAVAAGDAGRAPAVAPVDLDPAAAGAPVGANPALASAGAAEAVDVLWRGLPLPVSLVVGQERRIDFPEPMADLDVPQAVTAHSRLVLTPTGQLHWQAQEPFPAARVLATSVSGTLYQLDVRADKEGAPLPPLVIRDPVVAALTPAGAGGGATAVPGAVAPDAVAAALIPDFLKQGAHGVTPADRPDYVALTRFALAHYLGPARAIPSLDASPAPVPPRALDDGLRVQDALITVRPLASWQIGAHYVTALGVTNRRPFPVDFDPRALRGDLRFAAALHPTLAPAGSGHQHTVWAVVTDQPFHRAVAAHVAH
jgi:integrating conjugative element protein (TIGR03749 family)